MIKDVGLQGGRVLNFDDVTVVANWSTFNTSSIGVNFGTPCTIQLNVVLTPIGSMPIISKVVMVSPTNSYVFHI